MIRLLIALTVCFSLEIATSGAKRILVTGAAGFVGSHVATRLLERGDEVVVVDEVNDYYDLRIKEGNLQMLTESYGAMVSIYRGDICNTTFLDRVFQEHTFDAICHMAARAGVRPSIGNPFIYVHSNVKATVELLHRAVQYNISNFVFASSSSVYGGLKSRYFSELEEVNRPISPYAATKRSCEVFARIYQQRFGLSVTALRFFTVYGPRGRPDMAPFKFIDRISRGEPVQQFGDGSSSRDYTFVDDIAEGVVRAIDRPSDSFRLINLGRGSGTSLKKFLTTIEQQLEKKAKIELLPDQPGDVPYTCANVSLASEWLDYQALVPIEEGIRKTVVWYKSVYGNQAQDKVPKGSSFSHHNDESHQRRRLALDNSTKNPFLITGANSRIGYSMAKILLDQGEKVVLVEYPRRADTTTSEYHLDSLVETFGSTGNLSIFRGDLHDMTFLRSVFERETPSTMLHLMRRNLPSAAEWSNPMQTIADTVDVTLNLLELSKGQARGGFDVGRVVLGSLRQLARKEEALFTLQDAATKTEELLSFTYHHLYGSSISAIRLEKNCYLSREAKADSEISLIDNAVNALLDALDHEVGYDIVAASSSAKENSAQEEKPANDRLGEIGGPSSGSYDGQRNQTENQPSRFGIESVYFQSLLSFEEFLRLLAIGQWSAVVLTLGLLKVARHWWICCRLCRR